MACTATLKAARHENVKELAAQMKIHAYIDGGKPEERIARIESMRGLTLLQITDNKGKSLVSTLCTEKATTDPIAGKLLVNMVNELLNKVSGIFNLILPVFPFEEDGQFFRSSVDNTVVIFVFLMSIRMIGIFSYLSQ